MILLPMPAMNLGSPTRTTGCHSSDVIYRNSSNKNAPVIVPQALLTCVQRHAFYVSWIYVSESYAVDPVADVNRFSGAHSWVSFFAREAKRPWGITAVTAEDIDER